MNEAFVFDTYAIIEVIRGNENYKKYLDSKIIINDFIFAELCYYLIRENNKKRKDYVEKYGKFITNLNRDIALKAMEFRYKNKKKRFSMVDCVSYFMAKELGIRFLTGDKEFEGFENVEFVR